MKTPKDQLQQEIRKTLQSTLYHGTGIISAELNLMEICEAYHSQFSPAKDREDLESNDLLEVDALRAENVELKKQLENIIKLSGEKIPDIHTFTSTEMPAKDVTDEDIEKWGGITAMANSIPSYKWGLIEGAKAMRDGKIPVKDQGEEEKPINTSQDNICKFYGYCTSKSNGTIPYCKLDSPCIKSEIGNVLIGWHIV